MQKKKKTKHYLAKTEKSGVNTNGLRNRFVHHFILRAYNINNRSVDCVGPVRNIPASKFFINSVGISDEHMVIFIMEEFRRKLAENISAEFIFMDR